MHSIQELDSNASGKQEQQFLFDTLQRKQDAATYVVRQEEAKLFDVPIPLDVRPLERYASSDAAFPSSSFLAYHAHADVSELSEFYITQMARFGWQKITDFCGPETMLIFEKPNRRCCIVLRPAFAGRRLLDGCELIVMLA